MKKEEILKQQPFRSVLRIKEVESLLGPGAISGDTFKVTGTNRKIYKLRYPDSLCQARRIEKNVKLFPKAFPKFYCREGRYLLFDWVEGRTLTKNPSVNECYQLGKLCGEIHALNDVGKKGKTDLFFKKRLDEIKKAKIIDDKTLAKIVIRFKSLIKKLKIDVILGISDSHPKNYMIDKKGVVVYVDEEGLKHITKGLGFAKIKKWLKKEKQQAAFWKGYNEHHSSDFFDKDYEKFVEFLQLIRTIATKIRTNQVYENQLKKLKEIL